MVKDFIYKVSFCGQEIFNSDNDVQAVGFALGLHQQSNVPHIIEVTLVKGESITEVCSLSLLRK